MAVAIDTVLVPVDGTEEAEQAVEYAVTIAERYEANVHVLHVLDESIARGVQHGAVDAEAVADDHQAFMETIRQQVGSTVPISQSVVLGFSATQLSQSPVTVVLDAADEIGADFIVVPRESVREHPTAMLGKVAQHVLSYASQPVLSV
jgi:nucleotide-binding universal stress UspA family protein